MSVQVKICGLTTEPTMQAALDAGADYVGLVFFPPSPRNVEVAQAQTLRDLARGRADVVALFVDPSDELVNEVVATVSPEVIQLHGSETPERVAAIRSLTGRRVVKAIKVREEEDAEQALNYAGIADVILYDAKAPAGAKLPGGNGEVFDWQLLQSVKDRLPYMLSGGLTPDNVASAIRQTGALAVDVSSGVELSPGQKDEELIRRFLQAAKTANEAR